MTIDINYPKQFSKEYKDFIIVLSKFSELNNIKNLPFDANFFYKSRELEKNLENNQYYDSFVQSNNSKFFHNVKIVLIKNLKSDRCIFEGAKLFSKFNAKSNNELNFIFSNRLIGRFNNLCSDLLFGFLLKSYSFSKYKKDNKIFIVKSINMFLPFFWPFSFCVLNVLIKNSISSIV